MRPRLNHPKGNEFPQSWEAAFVVKGFEKTHRLLGNQNN